jgi:cytochrome oxidase Cu insertion factor (SCO1/SenC/PrrC family)
MKQPVFRYIGILALFLVIGAVLGERARTPPPPTQPIETKAVAGGSGIVSKFTLTDHNGQTVTENSWPDKYLLVYFGFTHCPDICPLGLNKIAEALKSLPKKKLEKIQPLFITVDPSRDDAAALKTYVPLFHQKIIGLTGTEDQIAEVKKSFKVYAEKSGDGKDYMVNHSAFTYVMNPNGSLNDVFGHDVTADELSDGISHIIP